MNQRFHTAHGDPPPVNGPMPLSGAQPSAGVGPARHGRHIAILFHKGSLRRDMQASVAYHYAEIWRAAGHRITLLRGPRRYVPADLLFVHVDLSVVPDAYLELASRYPAAVNHRVRDIRKSAFSDHRVLRPGEWDGPVIVKTDCNYGGQPERRLATPRWIRWPAATIPVMRLRRRRASAVADWQSYRIYPRFEDVPPGLVADPRLVIERFLPEQEGGHYHLRVYQFLGDRAVTRRLTADEPLVKSENARQVEYIETDPRLEEWRQRLGLDYGKLDYVVFDGKPVLLDVNKTTGISGPPTPEKLARRRFLAEGIESFFHRE